MNKEIRVGSKCRVKYDAVFEDKPSPFRGLEVTVFDNFGAYSKAGFDCFVKIEAEQDELIARHVVAHGSNLSEFFLDSMYHSSNFTTETMEDVPEGYYCEFDSDDLEIIAQPKQNERVLLVIVSKFGTLGTAVHFTRQKNEHEVRFTEYRPSETSLKRLHEVYRKRGMFYLSSRFGKAEIEIEYMSKFNKEERPQHGW